MKILSNPSMFSQKQIQIIEMQYNAKFICETCVKTITDKWSNWPVAIFYTKIPHPQGSNWFGFFRNTEDEFTICNGISATEPFIGIQIDDDVIYSKYRHDFFEHKDVFVDGGRDYMRCGGKRMDDAKVVKLQIVEDRLEIIE